MTKAKLTDWISVTEKPAHKGFYDYKYGHGYEFNARWNGRNWFIRDSQFPWQTGAIAVHATDAWRGLASDPKASA